jgi:hypothetical protein
MVEKIINDNLASITVTVMDPFFLGGKIRRAGTPVSSLSSDQTWSITVRQLFRYCEEWR